MNVVEKDFKKICRVLLGPKYVWCAEDEKYGLISVYATKRAAEKAINSAKGRYWQSGYGGAIIRRKVHE